MGNWGVWRTVAAVNIHQSLSELFLLLLNMDSIVYNDMFKIKLNEKFYKDVCCSNLKYSDTITALLSLNLNLLVYWGGSQELFKI